MKLPNKAWKLLKGKGRWCQESLARNKEGVEVDPYEKYAVSFCAVGAIYRIYGDIVEGKSTFIIVEGKSTFIIDKLHDIIKETEVGTSLGEWNDAPNRTQEEVVQFLKNNDV